MDYCAYLVDNAVDLGEQMKENKELHRHHFICSDTPGYYICMCGAKGIWNRKSQVIDPIDQGEENNGEI